jgi:hypothetical protein
LAENFKKVAFRDRYSEIRAGREEAKQIFGIQVPFILDTNKDLDYSNSSMPRTVILGEYKWNYDIIRIFHKRISILSQKYDIDFKSMIYFCFCHEIGHAKEQRLFEEIGFFPNTVCTHPEGIFFKIDSLSYVAKNLNYNLFIGGICDFSINKELAKHNIKNQLAKKRYFEPTSFQPPSTHEEARQNTILDCLLHLPYYIDIYEHGELDEDEKRALQESQETLIGDKWEKTLSELRKIEFFDPKSKIGIILELFENTLGIQAFLNKVEISHSRLPKFWTKSDYQIMHLP